MTAGPIPASAFLGDLARINGLEALGFAAWRIETGAGFGDTTQWWDGRPRRNPHEGIDLHAWLDREGGCHVLSPGSLAPAPFPGVVVQLMDDFLGQSVVLRHPVPHPDATGRLHSILAHCQPRAGLVPGTTVAAGDPVAAITAPTPGRSAPPHLHLTLLWLPDVLDAELTWDRLATSIPLTLIDPGTVLRTSGGLPTKFAEEPSNPSG